METPIELFASLEPSMIVQQCQYTTFIFPKQTIRSVTLMTEKRANLTSFMIMIYRQGNNTTFRIAVSLRLLTRGANSLLSLKDTKILFQGNAIVMK